MSRDVMFRHVLHAPGAWAIGRSGISPARSGSLFSRVLRAPDCPLCLARTPPSVMPGLVPGIPFHRFRCTAAWMPGTSPGMTRRRHDGKRVGVRGAGREACGDVMFCHAGPFPPGCGEGFGGGGRLQSLMPPSGLRAGRASLFCARFAWARGRARAGVGAGAVRAPDCARETAHAPRPSVPAGVFFAAPAGRFLQKRRKAAPEAASLYFHHTPYRQMSSLSGNKK